MGFSCNFSLRPINWISTSPKPSTTTKLQAFDLASGRKAGDWKLWFSSKRVKQPTSSMAPSGWYHMIPYDAMWYHMIPCDTMWYHHATHSFQQCWLHHFKNQTNSRKHPCVQSQRVFGGTVLPSKVCLALLTASSQFASKPYTCLCVVMAMTPLTMKL